MPKLGDVVGLVWPDASRPAIVPTFTRMPRMHERPTMISGSGRALDSAALRAVAQGRLSSAEVSS